MPGILQIQTPAASTKLTTVATAKAELNVTSTTDDTYIGTLIDRASAVVAGFIGNALGQQTAIETFRFGWSPGMGPAAQTVAPYGTPLTVQRKPLVLQLPNVVSITSIVENGTTLDPMAPDYEFEAEAALVWRMQDGIRSFWNVPTVVVTYVAGWVLPNDGGTRTLPFDIEEVTLALVRSAYFARGRDPNIAMDMLDGDRTQFWDRSVSGMVLDDALTARLSQYVNRAF